MAYVNYILIAGFIAATLSFFRINSKRLTDGEKQLIAMTVGWILVIYGLILSFSIGLFYNRYVTIREMFIHDITNLELSFGMLKSLNAPKDVLYSMRDYVASVIEDQLPALKNGTFSVKTKTLYGIMNKKIIDYVNNNKETLAGFTPNILMRMSTDAKVIQLITEIKSTEYYNNILIFLMVFILGPLYILSAPDRFLQFELDFSLLSILFSGLYLCSILNNPFNDSPIGIKFNGFKILLVEIDSHLDTIEKNKCF